MRMCGMRMRKGINRTIGQSDNRTIGQRALGLVTVRQVAEGTHNHILATEYLIDNRVTFSNKGIGFLFPLYLYPKR